ncbi:MAG: hypothetical protein ACXIT4_00495 [Erythrobacter sp.]
MVDKNTPAPTISLNSAVAALKQKRGAKPRPRTQADIVADNADTITALVQHHGATQKEVADILRDHGEPVLDDGFFAEMRKQLGTVKQIRSARASTVLPLNPATDTPASTINAQPSHQNEGFEASPFAARPPRR